MIGGERASYRKPLLVTGTHRSGTTWAGRMLALSPTVHYVHEPFAPMYERSWLHTPPTTAYLYQAPGTSSNYVEELRRIVALRPRWLRIARRGGGLRNFVRVSQDAVATNCARMRRARALVKDPFMLLSAEWMFQQTQADVVILVRHPAAFVSSIKRLHWRLDVNCFLEQGALMSTHLGEYASDLAADAAGEKDIVEHACLVWCVLNSIVARYETAYTNWYVLRYEDLASEPVTRFRGLYDGLGIPWTKEIEDQVREHNASKNRGEVNVGARGETRRDSRKAMWTWVDRLSAEEVDRVYARTQGLAQLWYGEDDWKPARESRHD